MVLCDGMGSLELYPAEEVCVSECGMIERERMGWGDALGWRSWLEGRA